MAPRSSGPLRVALGLGSGGARGFAHIGVVRALEERGHRVVAVAGTSMGALVGGMVAAGTMEEFADWATGLRQRDVLWLLDPKLSGPGMVSADRLLDSLSDVFEDVAIENLPIPFTAVATDLGSRREIWFQRGPLRAAVRASIAIPGLFTPVMLNGRILVDGGLTNPVPLDPTASVPSDLTVAVSLTGPRAGSVDNPRGSVLAGESTEPQRFEEWRHRLRRLAGLTGREEPAEAPDEEDEELQALAAEATEAAEAAVGAGGAGGPGGAGHGVAEPGAGSSVAVADAAEVKPGASALEPARTPWGTDPLPAQLRMRDVTAQSFEAMQAVVGRFRMAAVPADVHVTVPVDACRTMDFHKASELIELGHRLASEALDAAGL